MQEDASVHIEVKAPRHRLKQTFHYQSQVHTGLLHLICMRLDALRRQLVNFSFTVFLMARKNREDLNFFFVNHHSEAQRKIMIKVNTIKHVLIISVEGLNQ